MISDYQMLEAMKLLEQACDERGDCTTCPLNRINTVKCEEFFYLAPCDWSIDAVKKELKVIVPKVGEIWWNIATNQPCEITTIDGVWLVYCYIGDTTERISTIKDFVKDFERTND